MISRIPQIRKSDLFLFSPREGTGSDDFSTTQKSDLFLFSPREGTGSDFFYNAKFEFEGKSAKVGEGEGHVRVAKQNLKLISRIPQIPKSDLFLLSPRERTGSDNSSITQKSDLFWFSPREGTGSDFFYNAT